MELLARGGRSRRLAAIAVLATIALVTAGASAAQAVPVQRGGQSTLTFNPNIFSGLDPLGVGILPIAPAEASLGGESFPITGGRVSRDGRRARINHAGGIVFAGDNASVRVTRLRVRICCPDSVVSAVVAGQRVPFLALGGGTYAFRGRRLTYRGINAFLTLEAADALNQAFATDFFREGTRLGKLRIRLTLVL